MPAALKLVEIRRVSSEEQAKDDHAGLARQEAENRRTAERHGASIVKTFILSDVSRARFSSTPEWGEIRELINDPNTHIVADAIDRFVADYAGAEILNACQQTKTKIFTSSGELDLNTRHGRWLSVIMSTKAGDELEDIRHRVQGSKEEKRQLGIFPSADVALAIGIAYKRTKGQKYGRWTYSERSAQVREVFRLVVEEGLRNWTEVARLAGLGNPVTVRNMLVNPIYMGRWLVDEKRMLGPAPIKPDGRRKDWRSPDSVDGRTMRPSSSSCRS